MENKPNNINIVCPKWLIVGIVWLCLPFWGHGCVTTDPVSKPKEGDIDRTMAENSQMKKRLTLIERKNDVLEQENIQYKAREQQMAATIEKLNADLAALGHKYEMDMALNEEQILSLQEKYDQFELRSTQTITELNKLYEDLQTRRTQELKALNEKIAAQQTSFNQERDQLKQAHAAAELSLSKEISELKSALGDREGEIAALKKTNGEAAQTLDDVLKQLAQTRQELGQAQKDLEYEKAANAEMFEQLKTLLNESGQKN